MKSILWLLALLINLGVAMAFVPAAFESGIPAHSRALGAVIGSLFLALCCFLVAGRMDRLPVWGRSGIKVLCAAIPSSWAIGSLDHGTISGLEFLSLFFAVFLGWGSWRAFLLFPPKPNPFTDTDAAQ